jgi:hypothetical protein
MHNFENYLETISQINDLDSHCDNDSGNETGSMSSNGSDNELSLNTANSFKVQWLFHCGMLFQSKNIWWDDFKKQRSTTHEGIDISYYSHQNSDKIHCFDDCIQVPAMDDGIVLNICDDFLGKSIVIRHQEIDSYNRQVLYVYAHILPAKDLTPGFQIKKNSVIAKVCNTYKNPKLPPHLHFSCFEITSDILSEHLNWNLFSTSMDMNMINPAFL